MNPSTASVLLGRIALTYKLVTAEQLREATRVQGRYGNERKLGEILRDEGLDVQTRARVTGVRRDDGGVVVNAEVDGRVREFSAAYLLVATGRQPNTAGAGLEDLKLIARHGPASSRWLVYDRPLHAGVLLADRADVGVVLGRIFNYRRLRR